MPVTLIKLRTGLLTLPFVLLAATGCMRVPATQEIHSDAPISILRTVDGYLISQGRDSVLLYRDKLVQPDRPEARAHYVHPIFGFGGNVLTEDFPEDHLHHHGIFWAWHQIYAAGKRVGDGWIQEGITWDVVDVDVHEGEAFSELKTRVIWTSKPEDDGPFEPVVEEMSTITAFPAIAHSEGIYREIDFTINLRALVNGVRIGGSEDEKGYGGFSARVRLADDVQFTGRDGPVEPKVTAVDAGPWLYISSTDSPAAPSGLAILQHPSNPNFPQSWILRRRESMQNVKWPGRELVSLSRTEPVTLRYRIVVHAGTWSAALLERLYDRYAATAE